MLKKIKVWPVFLLLLFQAIIGIGQDFRTVAYLPTYRFHLIHDIELEALSHLNLAFANPDAQGKLDTDGISISPIVQQAHDAGLKVFIALAGAAAQLSDWEDWISADMRSAFIGEIILYLKQHELQGVDVDLEWGTVNADYSGFVLELKDSLDQHGLELSAALPGTYRYPEITNEALKAFDWVNLMAYDLTGPWTPDKPGPHSPYSYAEQSIAFWLGQGLDKSRMNLAVPFYGYDFTDLSHITAVSYAQMVALDPSNAQVDQVGEIYYNGLPTIARKTSLALDELGGIMVWELGQDSFGAYSLLTRIYETVQESTSTSIDHSETSMPQAPYPNPVLDVLHMQTHVTECMEVMLYTQSLKLVARYHFFPQQEISIDMKPFRQGVYFLSIKCESFIKTFSVMKL